MQERSDALPYAVIPNGNGLTPAGTPAGNNPDGSPLGPVATTRGSGFSSTRTGSLTHYLSGAYRTGADPTRPHTVNDQFPFTIFNINNGADFSCNTGRPSESIEGEIQRVFGNSFSVKTNDGKYYTVQIGSCSNLSANRQNYQPARGDHISLQGYSSGVQKINVVAASCW